MEVGVHGHFLVPALKHAEVEPNKELDHAQILDQPMGEANAQEDRHLIFHATITLVQ